MLGRVSLHHNALITRSLCYSSLHQNNLLSRFFASSNKNKSQQNSSRKHTNSPINKKNYSPTTKTEHDRKSNYTKDENSIQNNEPDKTEKKRSQEWSREIPKQPQTIQTPATQNNSQETTLEPDNNLDILDVKKDETQGETGGKEHKTNVRQDMKLKYEELEKELFEMEREMNTHTDMEPHKEEKMINISDINSLTSLVQFLKSPKTTLESATKVRHLLKNTTAYNEYIQLLMREEAPIHELQKVIREMTQNRIKPNIRTVLLMMRHLGSMGGKFFEAVQLLASCKEVGMEITSSFSFPYIKYALENGFIRDVIKMTKHMSVEYGVTEEGSYFDVLYLLPTVKPEVLWNCKDIDLEILSKEGIDINQATILAAYFSRAGYMEGCKILFDMYKQTRNSPELGRFFATILGSYQKGQALPQFWNTLEEIRQLGVPDLETYNAAIFNMARLREPKEKKMMELYEEMQEKKVVPNKETYEALILGFSKINIKHARQRYHQMVREDFTPSHHTIHALVKGYCDTGMVGECIEFLHVLRRAGSAIAPRDVRTILASILSQEHHQYATQFLEFFSRETTWLDIECCNILATIFAQGKQLDKIEALLQSMEKRGVAPDVNIYSTLANTYTRVGKLLDALSVLRKMTDAKMRLPDDTWRPVVAKLVRDGYKEDAQKVIAIAEMSGANVAFARKYIDKLA